MCFSRYTHPNLSPVCFVFFSDAFALGLAFPQDDEAVLKILLSAPWILGKNVNNHLLPTAEFLKDFYGPTLFREVRLISKQESESCVWTPPLL